MQILYAEEYIQKLHLLLVREKCALMCKFDCFFFVFDFYFFLLIFFYVLLQNCNIFNLIYGLCVFYLKLQLFLCFRVFIGLLLHLFHFFFFIFVDSTARKICQRTQANFFVYPAVYPLVLLLLIEFDLSLLLRTVVKITVLCFQYKCYVVIFSGH